LPMGTLETGNMGCTKHDDADLTKCQQKNMHSKCARMGRCNLGDWVVHWTSLQLPSFPVNISLPVMITTDGMWARLHNPWLYPRSWKEREKKIPPHLHSQGLQ
jgi:hypothetical protein